MSQNFFKRLLSSIILLPFSLFVVIKGSLLFNFLLIFCFIVSCYEWIMLSKNKSYKLYGFLYFLISFTLIYFLRNNLGNDYNYFLFVILICIFTDLGGYIFGKVIKGPKLTSLSPKKTFSGMIGGFILSQSIIILLFTSNFKIPYLTLKKTTLDIELIIFIFLISSFSQIGDIIISYYKRQVNIKDTGKLIPGHGGLLDRLDGIILACPLSYLFLKFEIFTFFK